MSALLDAWHRDGFVILRQVVSPSEVRDLANAFDRLLAMARSLRRTADHRGSRFVIDYPEPERLRLHRVVWCGAAEAYLAPWGSDERILAVASELLGSSELVQIIQQAHFKMPGDEVGFDWHQDASNRRYGSDLWTDVDGQGSFAQFALAVDPMQSDNGPLRVIPGSHKAGFIADPLTGALPDNLPYEQAVDLVLEPGDLAAFGPFLVHGSPPNRSSAPRRLFLQGYALPGANHRDYPGCGLGVPRTASPRDR